MLGKLPRDQYNYMTVRQRIDFAIMILVFGILVGVCVQCMPFLRLCTVLILTLSPCSPFSINAFTILTAQQLVRLASG